MTRLSGAARAGSLHKFFTPAALPFQPVFGGHIAMNALYWLLGILALGLFGYLVYALLKAERF